MWRSPLAEVAMPARETPAGVSTVGMVTGVVGFFYMREGFVDVEGIGVDQDYDAPQCLLPIEKHQSFQCNESIPRPIPHAQGATRQVSALFAVS